MMHPESRGPGQTVDRRPAGGPFVQQSPHEFEIGRLRGVVHGRDDAVVPTGQRSDDGEPGGAESEGHLVTAGRPVHRHVGQHEGLRVGAAGESDARLPPDGAVHAVGPDGVPGTHGLTGAHGERHARVVLRDGRHLERPVHVVPQRAQPGEQHALGLTLRDHQGVGVRRRESVERDGQQPARAVADGEPIDPQATRDQRVGAAQFAQHLQGSGMHDGGPGRVGALGQPIHDDELDAGGGEGDGQRESGRAGADDDDLGLGGQFGGVHGGHSAPVCRGQHLLANIC